MHLAQRLLCWKRSEPWLCTSGMLPPAPASASCIPCRNCARTLLAIALCCSASASESTRYMTACARAPYDHELQLVLWSRRAPALLLGPEQRLTSCCPWEENSTPNQARARCSRPLTLGRHTRGRPRNVRHTQKQEKRVPSQRNLRRGTCLTGSEIASRYQLTTLEYSRQERGLASGGGEHPTSDNATSRASRVSRQRAHPPAAC